MTDDHARQIAETIPWNTGHPGDAKGMMLLRTVYQGKVDYWLLAKLDVVRGYQITHWCPVEPPDGCSE
jgi:hypothetical protein